MADYAAQAANAGSATVSAWMLDDNSHQDFTWGLWSDKAHGHATAPVVPGLEPAVPLSSRRAALIFRVPQPARFALPCWPRVRRPTATPAAPTASSAAGASAPSTAPTAPPRSHDQGARGQHGLYAPLRLRRRCPLHRHRRLPAAARHIDLRPDRWRGPSTLPPSWAVFLTTLT